MNFMNLLMKFTVGLLVILFLSSCTQTEINNSLKDEVVYFGKGEEWIATFSIFKAGNSLFDSLYIQNIGGNREAQIGPIEYQLVGGEGFKSESQYPQEIQGVRSFHTSSELNADVFTIKPTTDGIFKLTIKNNGTTETLNLRTITH